MRLRLLKTMALLIALATVAMPPQTATAQSAKDINHAIALASEKSALSQKIIKKMALIALGYNTVENLSELKLNHAEFSKILRGLRYGDTDLDLIAMEDPEVTNRLDRVNDLWPPFDGAVRNTLQAGTVTDTEVAVVADMSLPMLSAIDDLIETLEKQAKRMRIYSMQTMAIEASGRASVLSQVIAKDYFLIASDYQPEKNRDDLRKSMAEFEEILEGLNEGNQQMLLMPPPTPQIKDHLSSTRRVWEELRSPLRTALDGGAIDTEAIPGFARRNLDLLAQLVEVTGMYEGL